MKIRNELAHTRLDLERAIKSGVGVSTKLMDDTFFFACEFSFRYVAS